MKYLSIREARRGVGFGMVLTLIALSYGCGEVIKKEEKTVRNDVGQLRQEAQTIKARVEAKFRRDLEGLRGKLEEARRVVKEDFRRTRELRSRQDYDDAAVQRGLPLQQGRVSDD